MPSSHMLANPSVVDEDQDNGPRMVNISPVCNFRRLRVYTFHVDSFYVYFNTLSSSSYDSQLTFLARLSLGLKVTDVANYNDQKEP